MQGFTTLDYCTMGGVVPISPRVPGVQEPLRSTSGPRKAEFMKTNGMHTHWAVPGFICTLTSFFVELLVFGSKILEDI